MNETKEVKDRVPHLGGIVLLGNQSPMPSQQSVWRDDAGKVLQALAAHCLCLECRLSPLVIVNRGRRPNCSCRTG